MNSSQFFRFKVLGLAARLALRANMLFYEIVLRAKFPRESKVFTHLTPRERIELYETARLLKESSISLEIGSYWGASACFICAGFRFKNQKLICIDTWQNNSMRYDDADIDADVRDTYCEFVHNTSQYVSNMIPLRGWSHELSTEARKISPVIDFLFIDGDHEYMAVKRDWELYSPFLCIGSYVAFHDIGWAEGVQRVVTEDVIPLSRVIRRLPNLIVFQLIREPSGIRAYG
jgi:predicted O-methyltransferase YrrM